MVSCENCNGACCRWIFLDASKMTREARIFYKTRGFIEIEGLRLAIKTQCPKLTGAGRCGIYEQRPLSCKVFKVGGRDCLTARKLEGYKDL